MVRSGRLRALVDPSPGAQIPSISSTATLLAKRERTEMRLHTGHRRRRRASNRFGSIGGGGSWTALTETTWISVRGTLSDAGN